jgi:PAS domain S-box-containing protein
MAEWPPNDAPAEEERQRLARLLEAHGAEVAGAWATAGAPGASVAGGPAALAADGRLLGEPLALAVLRDRLRPGGEAAGLAGLRRTVSGWVDSGFSHREAESHFVRARAGLPAALAAAAGLEAMDPVLARLDDELGQAAEEFVAQEMAILSGRCADLEGEVRAVYGKSSDAMLVMDPATRRIVDCSPSTRAVTGYPMARLCTLSLPDLLPEVSDEGLVRFCDSVLADGEGTLGDVKLLRRDGLELLTAVEGVLVRRRGARAILCILRDPGGLASGLAALEERASDLQTAVSWQLREIERLGTFLERIITALPIRLVVLDASLTVAHVNPAFYVQRGLARDDVIGHSITEVLPPELLEEAGLRAALLAVLETGERVRWSGYREYVPERGERVLNIRLDPCEGPDADPMVLLTMEDITDRHYQLFERTVLQRISRAILGELELPKLLHAILTGMTAGGAVGLGFNRATLLLIDSEAGALRVEMAVGPETLEDAVAVWQQVSENHRTLEDFLADFEPTLPSPAVPLRSLSQLVFPLSDTEHLPVSALEARRTIHVIDAEMDPSVTPALREALGSDEFVVTPLVARDKVIGVAIADNVFSQQPITQAAVGLLTALADQAALAIDTARTYQLAREDAAHLDQALQDLQAAHDTLLQNAQLAAIGEVTAIVAHEIRSPLSTIGGFARSIAREPELVDRSARNARIIVEEVVRLERILGELLDFSKPPDPHLAAVDLRDVLESVAERSRGSDAASAVAIEVTADDGVPLVVADEKQIRQVLTNLINNAVQAMPNGGRLALRLRRDSRFVQVIVQDTGEGIAADRLARIFDAFYTTKPTGTGLGLALCKKLVTQQGGSLAVESEEGQGTTFVVSLPLPADEQAAGDGAPSDG